jgi:lipid-A-disaccharide synthase
MPPDQPKIAIIVGEESGDMLGAGLIDAIRKSVPDAQFLGVAGERMNARGVESLFPVSDVAVMGISAVIARLPKILRRIRQTAAGIVAAQPDMLVIIDSPGFTHSVAKRVARKLPELPIVDYVSPSVWAWKSWRARQMARFIDHVLALLPFEPEVHRRLGGPPCTYVGHPLIEKRGLLRPEGGNRAEIGSPPVLVVLPGSRQSEIGRLMAPFGEAVALIQKQHPDLEVILPAVNHLREKIADMAADWPVPPRIVAGEDEKYAAFRKADCALAASGTVTLELALAQVPMVVAYRVEWIGRRFKHLLKVPSIVLANLIIEENVVPEFLDEESDPQTLADQVLSLLEPGDARDRQLAGFRRLDEKMQLPGGLSPSDKAAAIVLDVLARSKKGGQVRFDSGT